MCNLLGPCAFLIKAILQKYGGLTERFYFINLEIVSPIDADRLELEER